MAAPSDPAEAGELTQLVTSMGGTYGRGKYCPKDETSEDACLDVEEITEILAKSREPARLLEVWEGWHTIAPPMKPSYQRFVELSNKGARELGFADTGAMWRSRYDMAPDAFAKELDRLWEQLRPLYLSLHTHVRAKLREKYGDVVPAVGPIPAHLLGNIWAQDWSNVYDIAAPRDTPRTYSLTSILQSRKDHAAGYGPLRRAFLHLARLRPAAEDLLGAFAVRQTARPRRRLPCERVVHRQCRRSAHQDVHRPDRRGLHNRASRAGARLLRAEYKTQPMIFRDSANDGFHEAIGDTIALSVTPEYLVKVGLLDKAPDASGDIPLLLRGGAREAGIPSLRTGRGSVALAGVQRPGEAGSVQRGLVELRTQYQGVAPPSPRGEQFFDPGRQVSRAGEHAVRAVTSWRPCSSSSSTASCRRWPACTTPLHRCSIYGNAAAGERLRKTLAMGASRPWPDALEALTGQRQMDASAIADYFAPLKAWLDQQNSGRAAGLVMMNDFGSVEDWTSLNEVLLPFLVRCGAAALCGAMVGLERELRNKPAGFRTNILICVGAAMYMTVGPADRRGRHPTADPTRIAAQVVTGIGFLGAGCVIQSGGRVTGLTSAATIWVVAAIGIVAGAGFPDPRVRRHAAWWC